MEINDLYIMLALLLIFLIISGASFNIKQKLTDQTGNHGTKHVEIRVPLKYLNNLLETLKCH